MKKILFFLLISIFIFSISYSEINFSKKIKIKIKNISKYVVYDYNGPIIIEDAVCLKNLINQSIYDECIVQFKFPKNETFELCTYTKDYCTNKTFLEDLGITGFVASNIIPKIGKLDKNKSGLTYSYFKDIGLVYSEIKYTDGNWIIITIKKPKYKIDTFSLIIFIIICIIGYIIWKNTKKKGD